MGKRHPNHRKVKIHRSYTVAEVTETLNVHKNTVRNWLKNGLAAIDCKRPILIAGKDLIAFLQQRKVKNKQQCGPGEMYCVRCRTPRVPADCKADYSPDNDKVGNLTGVCPVCHASMNRRASLAKIGDVCGDLDILFPVDLQHIIERI
ncbi:helix-turn-helix domain-containing protein [Desulfogranum marinum]|uniref:helix-turn-helix domain-containing protein n=1 Tax=Desulfogranum marinum TaxID=453220 RepID=UPI0029C75D4B|nr:helix-turn-helix domain-containing protein [Desulfogranum marinum]